MGSAPLAAPVGERLRPQRIVTSFPGLGHQAVAPQFPANGRRRATEANSDRPLRFTVCMQTVNLNPLLHRQLPISFSHRNTSYTSKVLHLQRELSGSTAAAGWIPAVACPVPYGAGPDPATSGRPAAALFSVCHSRESGNPWAVDSAAKQDSNHLACGAAKLCSTGRMPVGYSRARPRWPCYAPRREPAPRTTTDGQFSLDRAAGRIRSAPIYRGGFSAAPRP